MPRRSNFKYQIDRRRDKTNREKDEQEEAFINADDEDTVGSKDEENEEEYEENKSKSSREEEEEYNDNNDKDKDRGEITTRANRKDPTKTTTARNTRRTSKQTQWQQKEESDDEEDHNQKKTEQPNQRPNSSRERRKVAPTSSEESEPEWPDEQDDPEDEDFVLPSGGTANVKSKDVVDDYDEDEEDEDLQEFNKPSQPRKRKAKNATSRGPAKRRRPARVQDSDDDIESLDREDDEIVVQPKRPSRVRPAAGSRTRSGRNTKTSLPPPTSPGRNLRATTARGSNRPIYLEKESDEDEYETDEDHAPVSTSRHSSQRSGRKKTAKPAPHDQSSDEEFLAESATENSDEKEVFYTDSEDDDVDEEIRPSSKKSKPIDVDSDDVGSAGFSSDGDDPGNRRDNNPSNKRKSAKEIQPISRDASNYDDDDSSSPDDAEPPLQAPARLPSCPSIDDAITLEPLPRIHVCYVSPDGLSRQCFSIETLRQIALNSNYLPFRVDLDGSTKDTFLQPPHFRTAMSDDLLDQIASRFGREALDLHGEFYNLHSEFYSRDSQNGSRTRIDDDDDDIEPNRGHQAGNQFIDHIQRYMTNQMGSRDIYACPLCYSEVHRRIVNMDRKKPGRRTTTGNNDGNDDDDEKIDDDEFLTLPPDSSYDPMTVLGWLDNDRFETSSCFCFSKVADLKQHLRDDHAVMTKDVEGNDLYQRFRVRGQDGLLQRYLHNQWKRLHANSFQGAMQIYWFQGNNQSFVYFLEQIKRAQFFIEILKSGNAEDEDIGEAEDYIEGARTFFRSFQSRAHLEWDLISSPFAKSSQKDDLKDFLADDDVEDPNEEEAPPFLAHRQLHGDDDSDPNDLVNKLQRKYVENYHNNVPSRSDDDSGVYDDDDDDEFSVTSDLDRTGYYSEEAEEDDDEWVASIRKKRQRKPSTNTARKTKTPPKTSHATPVGRKLLRRKASTPTSATAVISQPTPNSQRRRIAEESNSEADE